MDMVLDKYYGQFINCFIDDLLVYSNTYNKHINYLEKIFIAFDNAGLRLNKDKSHFIQEKVTFLEHTITVDGNKLDLYNLQKIENYPLLKMVTQVYEFLGLVGYYQSFIQNYFHHAELLIALTRKKNQFS